MDVWCDSISHLGLCFLNVWVWMKSTCKDNIWIGGKSVYNLNNVTLDVDLKCILVVQIYYRVFWGAFFKSFGYKQKYIFSFFLFWCLGWGGWRCYLAWNCMKFPLKHMLIKFHFVWPFGIYLHFFHFPWLWTSHVAVSNSKKYVLAACQRVRWQTDCLFGLLYALNGSPFFGQPCPSRYLWFS